jgi:hypothetical protein
VAFESTIARLIGEMLHWAWACSTDLPSRVQ